MAQTRAGPRRFESLTVFATVLKSRTLLRTQVAFLLFGMAELGTWVAILVYAYDRGGATAAGLVAFAQLAPAVLFAPVAAAFGERITPSRRLGVAHLAFALANLAIALLLLMDQPALLVYAGAVVAGLALTLVRPAHASVMPEIARTPSELTAANVASGTMENLGIIIGSIGGGILLGVLGPAGVYVAAAAAGIVAFLLVARLPTADAPRGWTAHLEHAPAWHAAEGHDDHMHGGSPAVEAAMPSGPVPSGGGLGAEIAAGLRAGLGNPLIRPLVLMIGISFLLQGMADVLMVVLAIEVTGMGESGVGLLSGAIGIGGLLGAALAIGLVGRRRLLGAMLLAALAAGVGLALPGLVPLAVVGLLGFFVIGSGRTLIDVVGRTLLQRVTPERYLTRIFGVVEGAAMAGLALGTLLAPLLVELVGPTLSLVAAGLLAPAGALLLRASLARSEAAGVVHERELAVIRRIGMFAPLPLPVLERLAAHAQHVHLAAGERVITEGDPGDCFYMIEAGMCVITRGDVELNRLGPGDGFGEIALLHDVVRTASVTAVTDMELFALDHHPFLEALTGQSAAYAVAREVAEERMGGHH